MSSTPVSPSAQTAPANPLPHSKRGNDEAAEKTERAVAKKGRFYSPTHGRPKPIQQATKQSKAPAVITWTTEPEDPKIAREIQKVISDFFPGEPVSLAPLFGGIISAVYKVTHNGKESVLRRCYTGCSRQEALNELRMFRIASEVGASPKLLKTHKSGAYHLLEYCPEGTLDLPLSKWITPVAQKLRALHDAPEAQYKDGHPSISFVRYRQQIASAFKAFHPLPVCLRQFCGLVKKYEKAFSERYPRRSITHHDVHQHNAVKKGEEALLIDFGMAGPDDPLIDLATMAMYFYLTPEQETEMLNSYAGGTASPELIEHYQFVRAIPYINKVTWPLRRAIRYGVTGEQLSQYWKKKGDIPYLDKHFQKEAAGSVITDLVKTPKDWAFFALGALKEFLKRRPSL